MKYIPILLFKLFFFTLFVQPRVLRFKMMSKGIVDAVKGVKGDINGKRANIVYETESKVIRNWR